MTPLARPQNDNRLTVDFRIRQDGRRTFVERRSTGGNALRHEAIWQELLDTTDRGKAERFCARAADGFARVNPDAVIRVESLPAIDASHTAHEARFHSSARV